MAVRIECDRPDYTDVYVEFKDKGWRFGDRRLVLEAGDDYRVLDIILPYVTAWNVPTLKGDIPALPAKAADLDDLDEVLVAWLITSWFAARAQVQVPSPN